MDQTSQMLKILLVENSRTARAVLARLLEGEGYEVQTVSTGSEAIDALKSKEYNLLIMDVFMPEMNGYEATQRIRALEGSKAKTPIVALTASTNERDKRTCLDAGMNDFIIKSENNEDLLNLLKKYQSQLPG